MVPRRDSSTTSFAGDTRDGALKQHMLILMPKSSLASSHAEMMKCVLAKLGGGISIGKDPFDAFDEAGTFKKNQDLLLQALQERQVRVGPVETQSDPRLPKDCAPGHGQWRAGKKGWGLVRINVRAPEQVVFACLQDFQRYPSMISAIRAAELHGGSAGESSAVRCSYRITKLWLEVPTVHQVEPMQGRVTFDIDPAATGLVLREASGFWQVRPDRGNPVESRVVFRVFAHASDLMPNWLVEYGARKCLKRATAWLKPYAEQLWTMQRRGTEQRCPFAPSTGVAAPLFSVENALNPAFNRQPFPRVHSATAGAMAGEAQMPPGCSAGPRAARLLLDDQGRPGAQSSWVPGLGLQLRSFQEVPGQPDLYEGDVLSVVGSSSLAEAKTEEEAMKRFFDECYAAAAQSKRGISCVISASAAQAKTVAPPVATPVPRPPVRAAGRARLYKATFRENGWGFSWSW
eukprot:s1784_g2.t2